MLKYWNNFIKTEEPTEENVKKFSEATNIPEHLAKRYFKRVCVKCGKKLNILEIGMFLRLYGRYDEIEVDSRDYFCHTHMAHDLGWSMESYGRTLEHLIQSCYLLQCYQEGYFD